MNDWSSGDPELGCGLMIVAAGLAAFVAIIVVLAWQLAGHRLL